MFVGDKLIIEFPSYRQRRFVLAYIKFMQKEPNIPMETVFYDKKNYYVVATTKTTEEYMIHLEANIAANMLDRDYEERMYYLKQIELWAKEPITRISRMSS